MLDATADSATLGKTAGKDAADNKPTYVSILGLEPSRLLAEKLRDDAHLIVGFLHAAFQHIPHPQFFPHVLYIHRLAFVGERRAARDHREETKRGEPRDQVFDDPVGQVLLRRIGAAILEGQNRDCRPAAEARYRRGGSRSTFRLRGERPHAIRTHRRRDVLQLLLAEILERALHLAAHLLDDRRRRADAARVCERFEPRGDVDRVAEDLLLDGEIAEMHPDAKAQAAILRKAGLAPSELRLHVERARDRVDGTGELREQVVADRVHDPAAMLAHVARDRVAVRAQHLRRRRLVLRHAAAVADRVGAQDRGELPSRFVLLGAGHWRACDHCRRPGPMPQFLPRTSGAPSV